MKWSEGLGHWLIGGIILACSAGAGAQQRCSSAISESTPTTDFVDHGDGTVTHTRTGLMWKRCAEGQSWSGSTCTGTADPYSWANALTAAAGASTAGYSDWRLPNVKELHSIVEDRCSSPAINAEIFPETPLASYWSASTNTVYVPYAWFVPFDNGALGRYDKTAGLRVRLVRAGLSFGPFDARAGVAPNAFDITDLTNQFISTAVTTNAITVGGLGTVVAATTTVGTLVKNGTNTGLASTTVVNGDTLAIRLTTSSSLVTSITGSLTVGNLKDRFSVTTGADMPEPGLCGDGVAGHTLTSAPTSGLCNMGISSAVSSGTESYTWSCAGGGGASDASCSATRNYLVTPAAGANGSISPATAQSVAYNASSSFSITPASGYAIASVTGCGGTLSGSTYTTAAVTAHCTVTASFVFSPNGSCGSANGMATAFIPTANLCSAGTASAVSNTSPWAWTCAGSSGGSTASCAAPNAGTATSSGSGRVAVTAGTWAVDPGQSAGFIASSGHAKSPPSLPAGYTFPHGLTDFTLTGGAGAATVVITYPSPLPAGTVYWKYGKTSPAGAPHWYQFPAAVIAGNTVTLTLTDGAAGDDDGTLNGTITDPGGPGAPGPAASIPTLSEWGMLLLSMLLAAGGLLGIGRRQCQVAISEP